MIKDNVMVARLMELFKKADVLTVDDGAVLQGPELMPVLGVEDNIVASIEWVDDDGVRFGTAVTEGALADGTWVGDKFICKDTEGETTVFRFFMLCPTIR